MPAPSTKATSCPQSTCGTVALSALLGHDVVFDLSKAFDLLERQGSVEGPACFLALYDIATWEVKTAGDRTAITAQQQGIGTEVNV